MSDLPRDFPRDICAYCGTSENLTDDHVPPKNLFPKPRPNNLISVPACPSCHSGTSKDDEYFRMKLCLRDDAGDHPSARAIWDSIFRSLKKKEARGFQKLFLSDIRRVRLHTPSGLYIGRGFAYNVDMNRIRRVVERTVRGLYFAESCRPLGLDNDVRVYSNEDLELQPYEVLDQLRKTILAPLTKYTPKVIGNNVFSYRHQIMLENLIFSVWAITFYGYVHFLVLTGPQKPVSI